MSPLLNKEQWDGCLRKSGYSGNDLILWDHEDVRCHMCSIIVSKAVEKATAAPKLKFMTLLVVAEHSKKQADMAELMREHVAALGAENLCNIMSLGEFWEARPTAEDVLVCLASLDASLLFAMSERKLLWLQRLMGHTKRLLWVTASR
jgi:hypothetical protein